MCLRERGCFRMNTLKKVLPSCLLVVISLLIGYGVAANRYKTEPVTPVSYEKQLETTGGTYFTTESALYMTSLYPLWQGMDLTEDHLEIELSGIVSDGSPILIRMGGPNEQDPDMLYSFLARKVSLLPDGASMCIRYADNQDKVLAEKTFNFTLNGNST